MKKKTILGILTFLLLMTIVSAADPVVPEATLYHEPYNAQFTTVSEIGMSLTEIRTELNVNSCYSEENWQTKKCQYLYYCYAILPSDSDSFMDALLKQCMDVTDKDTATLEIKQFIPPKGVLYYVVTFITKVDAECALPSCKADEWTHTATIPQQHLRASSIRSVCPEGQMLDFDMAAGKYKCYIAKKICIDTMNTGMCTNLYSLWALDKDENGVVDDYEMKTGSSICADRPTDQHPYGDGICDRIRNWECKNTCSKYEIINGEIICTDERPNDLCDEYDRATIFSCWDDVLSPNSGICDDVDAVCPASFDPVCVSGRGGKTFPNSCFAKANGFSKCPTDTPADNCYVENTACEPMIVQCYTVEDCPTLQVCAGGSMAGISKMCLNYRCSYTGGCKSLVCDTDEDCAGLAENICVGMYATCESGICSLDGSCLQPPRPKELSIWELILQYWNTFWATVKSVFT